MVKSQASDITDIILQPIRRLNGVHRAGRNRKSRGELLSTSEAQWFTPTKSDGVCLFEMADHGEHREHRLDEHALLPLAALTQFEVGRIAFRGMEGGIIQDDHLFFALANQPLKRYPFRL